MLDYAFHAAYAATRHYAYEVIAYISLMPAILAIVARLQRIRHYYAAVYDECY